MRWRDFADSHARDARERLRLADGMRAIAERRYLAARQVRG